MKPRLNKNLTTLLLLGGISSLLWIVLRGVILHEDSPSYIEAAGNVFSGTVDLYRTPGYPAFLAIMRWLLGERVYLLASIIIQHLVFLGSAACLFNLMKRVIGSDVISFWVSLFYVLYPFIASLNNYILAESFSMSGTVFLIALALRMKENGNWMDALSFTLLLTYLLLLKPAVVYLIPIFLVMWGYTLLLKGKWKNALMGMAGVVVATACLLSYMNAFKKEYGLFSPSAVSTLNNYHIARQYGLLKPELIDHPGIRADLEKSMEANGERPDNFILLFQEARHMILDHSLPAVNEAVSACNRAQPVKVLTALASRLYYAADDPLLVSYVYKSRMGHLLCFHMSSLFLFLIIYTVLLIIWVVRRKQIPWFTSLLYMMAVSQIIVAVLGAQSDWGRLILPVLTVYLLMIGQLCTAFSVERADSIPFN